jgi:hypothetical protein
MTLGKRHASGESGRPLLATAVGLGSLVHGYSAVVLADLLDRHGPDQLVRLQQSVDAGHLPVGYLHEVTQCWADIRAAAALWRSMRSRPAVAAADGSVSSPVTATPGALAVEMLDTDQAADLLHVTPNRVRQLIRGGELTGRKAGRTWLVSGASIHRLRETR